MPYRFELASTGRAVCNVGDHKKEKVKIGKGELRMGAWVEFGDVGSWKWRHWGCVTPQVLANIQDTIDGDYELVDGLDELPPELQDKIKRAIEQGHVDDEDWLHDASQNVVGAKGIKSPVAKKSKKKGDNENEVAAEEVPDSPIKGGKKRAKPKKEDDDDEAVAPPAKKSRGRPKHTESETGDGDEVNEPAKKTRGRPKTEGKSTEAANTKKVRGRPKAQVADDDEAGDEVPVKKPRGKKGKAKNEASTPEDVDENGGEGEAEPAGAPPTKKARGKASKKVSNEGGGDDGDAAEAAPKAKRGRKTKA
ncbi:MAG: hypothetical protein M1822_001022 [Bathelium mastoideum]|nr:MAG: hypothetical protein M1822_001022 [Bathelium mastoideum]